MRSKTQDGSHYLWWPTRSVGYYIQEDCALRPPPNPLPDAVADAGEAEVTYLGLCHAAVERSFQSWQNVGDVAAGGPGCTDLQLPYLDDTAKREVGYDPDAGSANTNLVLFQPVLCDAVVPPGDPCWADQSCDGPYGCFSHGAEVIALTTTTYQPADGTLVDADIEVNDAPAGAGGFDFSAEVGNPIPGTTDVQNTLTHEIGHFIGLDHNCGFTGAPVCTPTLEAGVMFKDAAPGEIVKRTLKEDDENAICHVYPTGVSSQIVNLQDSSGQTTVEVVSGPACSSGGGLAPVWLGLILALALRRAGKLRAR